jgi:peptide/nickel transport system ATP-binding protein
MASMPGHEPGARLKAIQGTVPALGQLPRGCAFAPRCPDRFTPCEIAPPAATELPADRAVRCYLHGRASEQAAASPSSGVAPRGKA